MSKIKCQFGNEITECDVTENLGYQNGNYVKAVIYHGEERIVIKRGLWMPMPISEKVQFTNTNIDIETTY